MSLLCRGVGMSRIDPSRTGASRVTVSRKRGDSVGNWESECDLLKECCDWLSSNEDALPCDRKGAGLRRGAGEKGEGRVDISGMLGTAGLPFSKSTGEPLGEVREDDDDATKS